MMCARHECGYIIVILTMCFWENVIAGGGGGGGGLCVYMCVWACARVCLVCVCEHTHMYVLLKIKLRV